MEQRPDAYVGTILLIIAVALVALIIAVLAVPGMAHDDVEALIALTLSLLMIVALLTLLRWS